MSRALGDTCVLSVQSFRQKFKGFSRLESMAAFQTMPACRPKIVTVSEHGALDTTCIVNAQEVKLGLS